LLKKQSGIDSGNYTAEVDEHGGSGILHGRLVGDLDVVFQGLLDDRPFAFDKSCALGGVS
jgi:hypothetical protein